MVRLKMLFEIMIRLILRLVVTVMTRLTVDLRVVCSEAPRSASFRR